MKLTYEYVKDYIESFSGYKLLSDEYIDNRTKLKIRHYCNDENYYDYEVVFFVFQGTKNKKGSRCPKCSNNKLTYEYVKNIIELVDNREYELLSNEYVNSCTKLKVRHKKCGFEYDISFSSFQGTKNQKGSRCPKCLPYHRLTYDYVKKYIESVDGYLLLSEEYNNCFDILKIKHDVKECGYVYDTKYNYFQQGNRCPKCLPFKFKYEYVKDFIESVDGYKLLSDNYVNNYTKLKIKHDIKECGHIYEVIFSHFKGTKNKKGTRCPKCMPIYTTSIGEQEVKDFVISNGIPFSSNDRSIIYNPNTGIPLEFDLWFVTLNKAIEYNGFYHSYPEQIERDRIKKEQCEKLGIQLLVIEEKDWYKNKEKCKETIMNFLK